MRLAIFFLLAIVSVSLGQGIADNPVRTVGTNVFDFTPLILAAQSQGIKDSPFLVSGKVSAINGSTTQVAHEELRQELTDEFGKEMLLAEPATQLKMLSAAQSLDRWRKGNLSAGEFLTMDAETRKIIYDEVQREKEDYVEVTIFVKNLPSASQILGKSIDVFALPLAAKANGSQSSGQWYDYGTPLSGDPNNFTNKYFVTVRGFVKRQMPGKATSQPMTRATGTNILTD